MCTQHVHVEVGPQRLVPLPLSAVLAVVVGLGLAAVGLAVVLNASPRRAWPRLVGAIVLGVGADAVAAGVGLVVFAFVVTG